MDEQNKEVLRKRAEALSKIGLCEEASEKGIEVIVFEVANENYAIELSYIKEVYPLKDLKPIPCVPAYVSGVVNIRRKIISVIDLKIYLGLTGKGSNEPTKMIILRSSEMEFGILADTILGIRHILQKDIQVSLPTLTGVKQEFFKGVTQDALILLDGAKLLANKNLIVNEEVPGRN